MQLRRPRGGPRRRRALASRRRPAAGRQASPTAIRPSPPVRRALMITLHRCAAFVTATITRQRSRTVPTPGLRSPSYDIQGGTARATWMDGRGGATCRRVSDGGRAKPTDIRRHVARDLDRGAADADRERQRHVDGRGSEADRVLVGRGRPDVCGSAYTNFARSILRGDAETSVRRHAR